VRPVACATGLSGCTNKVEGGSLDPYVWTRSVAAHLLLCQGLQTPKWLGVGAFNWERCGAPMFGPAGRRKTAFWVTQR
jgi:hypothetical protein